MEEMFLKLLEQTWPLFNVEGTCVCKIGSQIRA
jgi:hypothetical protein